MQGLEEPTEVIGTQRADRSGGLRALIGQGGLSGDAQYGRSVWTMPIHDWKPALNRFAIEFAGRLPA